MRRGVPVINWSTRLFRMLLILYPGTFRRDYSREMTLVFRDTCRQTIYRQGMMGLLELWLTTLLDLFSTALVERLSEVYQMSTTALFTRLSGLVAALGGLILLILVFGQFVLGSVSEVMVFLLPAYGLCVAVGAAGFYVLGQYAPTGRVGLGLVFLGGLVSSAGVILLFFLDSEAWWATWAIGVILYQIGLVVFGWSAFKHKALPRWSFLPLVVGGVALAAHIPALFLGPEGDEVLIVLSLLINGLGWLALGALLMLGDKRAAYHTGAAA